MVSGAGATVGPVIPRDPAPTMPRPANPVSVEPIASVMNTFGSAAAQALLTAGENRAALDDSDSSDEAS